jgi:hypothetical protein
MRRREVIGLLGGAAITAPVAAQQPAVPVIGFPHNQSFDALAERLRGLGQGLKETGYIEGENVTIDYRWAENQNETSRPAGTGADPLPARRQSQGREDRSASRCRRAYWRAPTR